MTEPAGYPALNMQDAFVARIRRGLGELYGDPEAWTLTMISRRGPRGAKRTILRGRNATSGCSVAIKVLQDVGQSREQFHALRTMRLYHREIVEPLFLAQDGRFFITEWIDAPLLSDRLDRGETDRSEAIARGGSWLARLHSATLGRGPFPSSTLHPLRLAKAANGKSGEVAVARARLGARLASVSEAAGPIVMLHGDYQMGNLFDVGESVVAFDRQFNRHGVAFFDVATFLSYLAQRRDRAAARSRPWPGDHDADRRSFFAAYGAVNRRHLGLLDAAEDLVVFRRWRSYLRKPAGPCGLARQMRARGLLGDPVEQERPGRLVAQAGGGDAWTNEPAPTPKRRPWARVTAIGRRIMRGSAKG